MTSCPAHCGRVADYAPRALFATQTRPTTGEPNFEEGFQAATLEAELADERDNRRSAHPDPKIPIHLAGVHTRRSSLFLQAVAISTNAAICRSASDNYTGRPVTLKKVAQFVRGAADLAADRCERPDRERPGAMHRNAHMPPVGMPHHMVAASDPVPVPSRPSRVP